LRRCSSEGSEPRIVRAVCQMSTGQDRAIEIRQPVLSHSLRYLWYLRQVAANADVVQIENDDRLGQRHVDLRCVIQVCGHPRRLHRDGAVAASSSSACCNSESASRSGLGPLNERRVGMQIPRQARSNSTMRRERSATSTSARSRLSTVVPTASTIPCSRISNVSKRVSRRSRHVSSARRRPARSRRSRSSSSKWAR